MKEYTREPASEEDEAVLDTLLDEGDLAVRLLDATGTGDGWSDLVFSISIADPIALLRAMPEKATKVGLADAGDHADDLVEVARWAFAHFVGSSFVAWTTVHGKRSIVGACETCGAPVFYDYPGAWIHAPAGDDINGGAGVALDEAHTGRPGASAACDAVRLFREEQDEIEVQRKRRIE